MKPDLDNLDAINKAFEWYDSLSEKEKEEVWKQIKEWEDNEFTKIRENADEWLKRLIAYFPNLVDWELRLSEPKVNERCLPTLD